MIREKVISYVKESLYKLAVELGLDIQSWDIDLSQGEGEGHGYLLPEDHYYEELSYVYLKNKHVEDTLDLWLDVAFVESMSKPIYFVKSIYSEKKISLGEYGIRKVPNPSEYLKAHLTENQYEELMTQPYFAQGKHMRLYEPENE